MFIIVEIILIIVMASSLIWAINDTKKMKGE